MLAPSLLDVGFAEGGNERRPRINDGKSVEMAAILRTNGGDERRAPTWQEAVGRIEGGQARKSGCDKPEVAVGVGQVVHPHIAGNHHPPWDEARIVLSRLIWKAPSRLRNISIFHHSGPSPDGDDPMAAGQPHRRADHSQVRVERRARAPKHDDPVGVVRRDQQRQPRGSQKLPYVLSTRAPQDARASHNSHGQSKREHGQVKNGSHGTRTRDLRRDRPARRVELIGLSRTVRIIYVVDREELRAVQSPLKERYAEYPDSALVTLSAVGELGEGVSCSVQTGRAIAEAGLHPATGGDGSLLCSGDMLLEALVACAGVTLRAVASSLGISVPSGRVRAEGDLDFRGTLGVDREAPVGFSAIRLSFELESDVDEHQLETLQRLTERYCVVYQTLASAPPLHTTFKAV
jgi:uncharacterized OsmC-like protein